jgi:hypothetical protein
MPLSVARFEATPNPNALKCILNGSLPLQGPATRPFRSAADATADPLAARLFAVPGVTGLLFAAGWITVNKAPDVPWKAIKPAVERALAQE